MRPERRGDGGYGHPDSWLVYNIPRLGPMQLMPMQPARFPSPIEPSRKGGSTSHNQTFPAPLIAGARPNLRSGAARQQRENPPAGELLHTAHPREALRHRCDAKEEPMSDLAARFVYSPLLSTTFKVVCLFCVLGLVLSAAIVPMIAPEYMAWVLSHIE